MKKCFGVFEHRVKKKSQKQQLLKGFDDRFWIPHSRHTEIHEEDLLGASELEILAVSEEAGIYLVSTKDGRQIFATGHAEYDRETLAAAPPHAGAADCRRRRQRQGAGRWWSGHRRQWKSRRRRRRRLVSCVGRLWC